MVFMKTIEERTGSGPLETKERVRHTFSRGQGRLSWGAPLRRWEVQRAGTTLAMRWRSIFRRNAQVAIPRLASWQMN